MRNQVVSKSLTRPVQGEAFIIIEAKRSDKKPSDTKDGNGQLVSYMAASPDYPHSGIRGECLRE